MIPTVAASARRFRLRRVGSKNPGKSTRRPVKRPDETFSPLCLENGLAEGPGNVGIEVTAGRGNFRSQAAQLARPRSRERLAKATAPRTEVYEELRCSRVTRPGIVSSSGS